MLFIISYNKHGLKISVSILCYIMHLLSTVYYWHNTLIAPEGVDARLYYETALYANSAHDFFGTGTKFQYLISYVLIHCFGIGYFGEFMIFSTFGFIGFLKLYNILSHFDDNQKIFGIRIMYIILFLPQFHYWTCALGKDSLTFFASMMLVEAAIFKRNKINIVIILSTIMLLLVRTYVGVFMVISFALAQTLSSDVKTYVRVISTIIFIGLFSGVSYFFGDELAVYFGVSDYSAESIDERINYFSDYAQSREGSYIDPNAHNIIVKMFFYLFRPFFIDAGTTLLLFSSVENFILLCIIIKLFRLSFFKYLTRSKTTIFLLSYFLISLTLKSMSLYNLGMANRQKYMILPYLFVCLFYLQRFYNEKKRTESSVLKNYNYS